MKGLRSRQGTQETIRSSGASGGGERGTKQGLQGWAGGKVGAVFTLGRV